MNRERKEGRNEKRIAVWMNSMYGGDAPPGPSVVYGREEGRIEGDGNGVETTGDAAYYQVTSAGEYAHHYTTPNGQYVSEEELKRIEVKSMNLQFRNLSHER